MQAVPFLLGFRGHLGGSGTSVPFAGRHGYGRRHNQRAQEHMHAHTHTHVQHWHGWVSLCEETLDLSDQPDAELDDRLWGSPDPRFGKAVQAQGWQVFIHGRTPSCARQ